MTSKVIHMTVKTKQLFSQSSLRVMSYNIHLKDCECAEETDEQCLWSYRKNRVASIIRFHHMDLIGLQEATKDQIMDLINILPEYDWVGVGLNDGKDKGPIDAILYSNERFELLESSYFYLSPTPSIISKGWKAKFIRGVTWAKFKDLNTNQVFFIFNTHFDYHSKLARNKSAQLLREKINEIALNYPFIITGDFNLFPTLGGHETYKILTRDNMLVDAHFKSSFPHHGPTGSWSGFKEAGQPGIKPDYIFVNKKANVLSHGILADTFDGNFPSDHLPVVSEIDIK
ncbi:MAG: endonuclease/exonuclease/phosphatase family protein [Parachlamydiales bacterium]|nr:endonuclease/exonuclease/phosphatase family protein [Parachlamydiales bacterium]